MIGMLSELPIPTGNGSSFTRLEEFMPVPMSALADAPPHASTCRVLTDNDGQIVLVSDNAAALLNSSVRGLEGRSLPLFITQDRPHLLNQMKVASRGHEVVIRTVVRPKERQPRQAHIKILRLDTHRFAKLEWLIELF